jgi:hypothetical protein
MIKLIIIKGNLFFLMVNNNKKINLLMNSVNTLNFINNSKG